ncbi:MAG: hypothetical protein M0Z99_18930 [Betaproteobacteria bacterium]|nr:hypothetical protein [Betaproteobacteria bacterium]
MDEARWSRLLERLPEVEETAGAPLAVAFINSADYAAKRGQAWLWWPGSRARATGPVAFDGRFPADWGLLLVMNDMAIAKVGADGTACMAHLARLLDIKPFVLQQRDELEAAGILEFIETLELATPKH